MNSTAGDRELGMELDVFTFGETMVRLSTRVGERLETAHELDLRIGGTESNVAIALARLGRTVGWGSVLPANQLGRRITGELSWHGVDTSSVLWTDDGRVGVYFLDTGSTPRATQVLYDRKDSAVACVAPERVDVRSAATARVLHLTGITPALSQGCAEVLDRLVDTAKRTGRTVSFDVNYRSLLWSPADASDALSPLCRQADILFCGLEDAETIWGITGSPNSVVDKLARRFESSITVLTLGADGAIARTADGASYHAEAVPVDVVDPVGAGDAFAAGFLHGYLDDDLERALAFGTAMAALKMTIRGDLAIVNQYEVDAVIGKHIRSIIR